MDYDSGLRQWHDSSRQYDSDARQSTGQLHDSKHDSDMTASMTAARQLHDSYTTAVRQLYDSYMTVQHLCYCPNCPIILDSKTVKSTARQ